MCYVLMPDRYVFAFSWSSTSSGSIETQNPNETKNLVVLGSIPPSCNSLDLFSVDPSSTPRLRSWGCLVLYVFLVIVKRYWIAIEIAQYMYSIVIAVIVSITIIVIIIIIIIIIKGLVLDAKLIQF